MTSHDRIGWRHHLSAHSFKWTTQFPRGGCEDKDNSLNKKNILKTKFATLTLLAHDLQQIRRAKHNVSANKVNVQIFTEHTINIQNISAITPTCKMSPITKRLCYEILPIPNVNVQNISANNVNVQIFSAHITYILVHNISAIASTYKTSLLRNASNSRSPLLTNVLFTKNMPDPSSIFLKFFIQHK